MVYVLYWIWNLFLEDMDYGLDSDKNFNLLCPLVLQTIVFNGYWSNFEEQFPLRIPFDYIQNIIH